MEQQLQPQLPPPPPPQPTLPPGSSTGAAVALELIRLQEVRYQQDEAARMVAAAAKVDNKPKRRRKAAKPAGPHSDPASDEQPSSAATAEVEESHVVRETKSVYVPYIPQSLGFEHSSPLVISNAHQHALIPIDPRLIHPKLKLNPGVSAAQRDAVSKIFRQFVLGFGFLLGDGTGVGKGRIQAAVLYNFFMNNPHLLHKKAIFVSASDQLIYALKRDMTDIGWHGTGRDGVRVRRLTDWKHGEAVAFEGILFVTYSALRGQFGKPKSRVNQLVQWATQNGKVDFESVICFDEIHIGKNPLTTTNKAVVELQRLLPKAKCLYSSATAMSSIKDLSPMVRLGLCGPDTAYPTFKDFEKKWSNSSKSALEIVSAYLSRDQYISRRLSFQGCTFETMVVEFSDEQRRTHRELCEWWTELSTIPGVLTGKSARSQLYASHLRFFRSLLVSYRVDKVVERAEREIASGKSAIVSLIGTGEASARKLMASAGEDEVLDVDGMSINVEDGFVALNSVLTSMISLAISSYEGESVPTKLFELKMRIEGFKLPPSPLDFLVHKLESIVKPDGKRARIVELTGRSAGFYWSAEAQKWEHLNRGRTNVDGANLFQRGVADVAILSPACAVGISLHDQTGRQRVHFFIELPYAADQAVQGMGRSHRSNQRTTPHYVIAVSDLLAETRFVSSLAYRVDRLGAGTLGDRKGSVSSQAFGSDLLVGPHSVEGLRFLFRALEGAECPKWFELRDEDATTWADMRTSLSDALRKLGVDATTPSRQFMGRLLGVERTTSNQILRLFEASCVEAKVLDDEHKRVHSRVDVGVEDIRIDGDRTRINHEANGMIEVSTDIGIEFEDALKVGKAFESGGGKFSFFRFRDEYRKDGDPRFGIVMARLEGSRVRLRKPNGRETVVQLSVLRTSHVEVGGKNELFEEGYKKYEIAKRMWDMDLKTSMTVCSHGANCRNGPECTFGKRRTTSVVVKLTDLDVFSQYDGPKQLIRLENDGEVCCAVRISKLGSYNAEKFEEALRSSAERARVREEAYERKVQELLAQREAADSLPAEKKKKKKRKRSASSSTSLPSSSSSSSSSETSDSEEEEELEVEEGNEEKQEEEFAKRRRTVLGQTLVLRAPDSSSSSDDDDA